MRPKTKRTETGLIRSWHDPGGVYRVAECRNNYGLPTVFLVIRRRSEGEVIVSRHRKRTAALAEMRRITKG